METLQEKYHPLLSGILPENTEIVFMLLKICTTKAAVTFGQVTYLPLGPLGRLFVRLFPDSFPFQARLFLFPQKEGIS